MFPPMEMEGANYYLKAMNCPMHNLIFRSRGRSYRELPLRLFEFGSVYRYEKSGVVHGLTRVRGMTQDDSHSYVTPEQAPAEIKHLLDFVPRACSRTSGSTTSTSSCPPATTPSRTSSSAPTRSGRWRPQVLEEVATESGLELVPDPGGAAFYGPKISVQARDAIGRTWQMSTIQYDFNQPQGLRAGVPGRRRHPAAAGDDPLGEVRLDRAVHRRARRALRRRVPALARAGAGAGDPDRRAARRLPRTTSPRSCGRAGIRVEVDDSDDRMQKKIRNAQLQKVPFMLIAGDDDVEAGAVSFRYRDGDQDNGVPVDEAIARVVDAVAAPGRRYERAGSSDGSCAQDGVGEPDGSSGSGRRTGWPTSRGENKPADGVVGGVPVLPDPDAATTRRGWSCTAARRRTPCSTSTPTARAT